MDDAGKPRRLFVGIELQDEARQKCSAVARDLKATGFDARYEATPKMHVTLAFLGNVDAAHMNSVAAALDRSAQSIAAFSVTLDRLAAFPHEKSPRVVYIGSRDQGAAYRALSQNVRSAYAALGHEFKEDSVAHVTIARVKAPHRPLPTIEFDPIALPVATLSLFESSFDPANNTSRYQIIHQTALHPSLSS